MTEVQEMIPQRYPFQMIDKFGAIIPGQTANAIKLVTINEWFFKHPTANMAVPRPILLEMLAQMGSAAILKMPEYAGKIIFFGGIREAEFTGDARPGDRLDLQVTMKKLRKQIGIGDGTVTVDGQVICQAELIFAAES